MVTGCRYETIQSYKVKTVQARIVRFESPREYLRRSAYKDSLLQFHNFFWRKALPWFIVPPVLSVWLMSIPVALCTRPLATRKANAMYRLERAIIK